MSFVSAIRYLVKFTGNWRKKKCGTFARKPKNFENRDGEVCTYYEESEIELFLITPLNSNKLIAL